MSHSKSRSRSPGFFSVGIGVGVPQKYKDSASLLQPASESMHSHEPGATTLHLLSRLQGPVLAAPALNDAIEIVIVVAALSLIISLCRLNNIYISMLFFSTPLGLPPQVLRKLG